MPAIPAINISQVLGNLVSGVASNFLSEGEKALPAIGVALIAIAGLFVIFYWTARAFGWRVKLPVKPPKDKNIIGKRNKVHFERSEAIIWKAFARLGKMHVPGTRRSGPTAGFDNGFVFGFGDSLDIDADDYDLLYEGHTPDLYADDGKDGFYADPSYDAPYTSDSGPDDSPGAQSGGASGDMLFFNDAASFYRHYAMDYEAVNELDEHLQQDAIDDIRASDQWMSQYFEVHSASVSANWSRLFPDHQSFDGLAASSLSMDVKAELFRHAAILNDLKEQSISSDDLADMDIDFDGAAYDH